MGLSVSKRSELIVQSEIRNMTLECVRVGGINLSQGVCDTPVPEIVKQAAKDAIDIGNNFYTRYDGIPDLRQAISRKLADYNNISANPDTDIVVSGGSTGAFYSTCLALLNPGDEVIIFEPFYGYHINCLLAVDAVPVYVKLNPPDWNFDTAELESKITSKTKAIVINTPANPCGKVFTGAELEWLADFAIKHDIFIFTDEIYEYFVFDNKKHISPASIDRIKDRTITISGYSKTFSITGWRLGYVACDYKWREMIGYVSDLVYVCAPSPLQYGVAAGIVGLEQSYYNELCNEFVSKRKLICDALQNAGITPYIPQGAYYVLADVSRIPGDSSKEKALYILHKIEVASVPGCAFYNDDSGENLVRFCFAKDDNILNEACDRIKKL